MPKPIQPRSELEISLIPKLNPGFEYINGTNICEPFKGRESLYRPWEATPSLPRGSDEAIVHQNDVGRMVNEMINHSEYPEDIKDFIRHQFMSNGAQLDTENQASYMSRVEQVPELVLDDKQNEYHKRSLIGTANMLELVNVNTALGVPSYELGKVSYVNGMRTEHVPAMFRELYSTVISNPEHKPSPTYGFQILNVCEGFVEGEELEDMAHVIKAMTFKFKRLHDTLHDGTMIKEETILSVLTDKQSGFDQGLMLTLKKIVSENKLDEAFLLSTRLMKLAKDLAFKSYEHPLVAAGVTKLYAYNKNTAEAIKARDKAIKSRRVASSAFDSTLIYYAESSLRND